MHGGTFGFKRPTQAVETEKPKVMASGVGAKRNSSNAPFP